MRNALHVARRAPLATTSTARPLIALVFEGLSEDEKQLPSVLLYDAEGSRLFENVCLQPEYYLARAEQSLLRTHREEIARLAGPRAAVVEYGSGAGLHGRELCGLLPEPHCYVPLDVDADQLARAVGAMHALIPTMPVYPVCQDFRQYVSLPPAVTGARRRLAYFPGSTIGNFRPLEAVALLSSIRESVGPQGALLIGVDLAKDHAVLRRAYNDQAGAMAAFNLNLLSRLNRELEATFELGTFRHRAVWNDEHKRIEMSLMSLRTQIPTVAGIGVPLAAGESIVTEYAYKTTADAFAHHARIAGWNARRSWIDAANLYSLQYLEAAE
jgi:dimethylhistidine N-methyltransferase